MKSEPDNFEDQPLDSIQPEFELGRATFHGATLLHRLIQMKDLEAITKKKEELSKELINKVCERKWPPHAKDQYLWTQLSPLNLACWMNQEEVAMMLLMAGADPNIVCCRFNLSGGVMESTGLWWAACHGKKKLVKLLLECGARVDLGENPMSEAANQEIKDMLCSATK